MKNNSLRTGTFSLVQMLIIVAILALLAVFVLPKVHAQPFPATNAANQSISGVPSYQDNLSTPLRPSAVMSRQLESGVLAGSQAATNTANVISFGTNIYSTAPVVVVCTSSPTNVAALTAVTRTNITVATSYNANTIYWHAVGH